MKNTFTVLAGAALLLASCSPKVEFVNPMDYVNPHIATCSTPEYSFFEELKDPHANARCLPGPVCPFGLVSVDPSTINHGDNPPGYNVHSKDMKGFTFIHSQGTGWMGEYGNFLTMATTGDLQTFPGADDDSWPGYKSDADLPGATAVPGYYSVDLQRYNIKAEATATPHCGILRFTFPDSEMSRIQSDLSSRVTGASSFQEMQVLNDSTICGHMVYNDKDGGWGNGNAHVKYDLYFYAQYSKPMTDYGFWTADIPDDLVRNDEGMNCPRLYKAMSEAKVIRDASSLSGKSIGFFSQFPTKAGDQVEMKVAFSFVDIDGAKNNFDAEVASTTFEQARQQCYDSWKEALSKVKIAGGTEDEKTIFYTALYHSMMDPHTFTDVDGRFWGGDGNIHSAEGYLRRTQFSGWDIFRHHLPLMTIINPELISDVINSQIALAEESGKEYYNRWECANAYTYCMVGNPTLPLIADAYHKGIRGFDTDKALRYAINTSKYDGNQKYGWDYGWQTISQTLESAYGDWCIGRFAEDLGDEKTAEEYYKWGQAYKNLFKSDYGWFLPRDTTTGEWLTPPEKGKYQMLWHSCESNAFQQGWFVPHDMDSLIEMAGGKEKCIAELDTMFNNTPWGKPGWTEYYNHSNEVVHYVPYIYNRLGEPWRTQEICRTILKYCYTNDVEGETGNDDEGQMSAWYVLTAAGIVQTCPGDSRVDILSPVFDEVQFELDPKYYKGKSFTIRAHEASDENIYVQKASLNGKPLKDLHFDFSAIADGGRLDVWMGPDPVK